MFQSIVALSRLDACIYTMLKGQDIGYTSFLAMAVMLHSLQVRECNFISSLLIMNYVLLIMIVQSSYERYQMC
jgi:hypothetical protein